MIILDIGSDSMGKRTVLIGLLLAALALAQSPALSGIAHVAFRVSDIPAAREFYQKLGFEQFFEFSQDGKTTQAFLKINDRQFIELYPRTNGAEPLGLMHVCYEADDLAPVNAEYVKRGLKPSAVRKAGAGNLLFVFRDPEEQVLEYTQYLPGSRHFEDRGKHLGSRRVSQQLTGATVPVRDVAAERTYYTGSLGFEAGGDGAGLRIPGGSGQEVTLAPAAAKPGLRFAVADVKRAAGELRSRGLAVKTGRAEVSVADPDGTVIAFGGGR